MRGTVADFVLVEYQSGVVLNAPFAAAVFWSTEKRAVVRVHEQKAAGT